MKRAAIAVVLLLPALAWADPPVEAEQLSKAMLEEVTLDVGVPARHCREASHGCEKRVGEFASYFVRYGYQHGVDPWTLAAIAINESALHPFVQSRVGAAGIMQLHPRGVGSRSRFVSSDAVRRACRHRLGACQEEIVDIGAEHFAFWVRHCGDEELALGGYNTGRCVQTSYADRVLSTRRRMRRRAAAK